MRLNSILLVLGLAQSAFSSPLNFLGTWGLEGFAKDNPMGATTGGKGGKTVYVDTEAELRAAVAGTEPRIVRVHGAFNLTTRLSMGSNKSLIGVGTSASITGSGITVNAQTNVILQNLKISYIYDNDCITIQNSTRVWVDHNEFTSDINQGPDTFVSSLCFLLLLNRAIGEIER